MKMKNLVIIVLLITCKMAVSTELEIVNESKGLVSIQPILSLAGRESLGKLFKNIPNEQTVKYSSGIYKIIGFNIETEEARARRRIFTAATVKNLPVSLDVTNRNAQFIIKEHGIILIMPDKNNQATARPIVLIPGDNAQQWERWGETIDEGFEKVRKD